jgi:hypothetical protein
MPLQLTEKLHLIGPNLPDIYSKNDIARAYMCQNEHCNEIHPRVYKKLYYYNKSLQEIIKNQCYKKVAKQQFFTAI